MSQRKILSLQKYVKLMHHLKYEFKSAMMNQQEQLEQFILTLLDLVPEFVLKEFKQGKISFEQIVFTQL
jgi:hypothetical protein